MARIVNVSDRSLGHVLPGQPGEVSDELAARYVAAGAARLARAEAPAPAPAPAPAKRARKAPAASSSSSPTPDPVDDPVDDAPPAGAAGDPDPSDPEV